MSKKLLLILCSFSLLLSACQQKESAAPDPNVYYTIDEEANVVLKINRMDEPSNEDDIELARFPLPFNWENYDTDFDRPTKKGLLFWKLDPEQELTGERGPMTYTPVSNTNFYFFNNEEETFTELPDYTLKATDTEIEEPYDLYGSTSENKMVIVIAQITTEAIYSSYFDPGIGFGPYPNSYYGLLYDISSNTLEKIDLENYDRFSTKIWDSKNEKMVEFLYGEGCGSCGVVFSNLKTGVEKEIRPWDMNFGRVANLWTDEEANWVTIMGESTEGHTIIFLYDGYGNLLKEKTLIGVSLKNAEERSYSDDYHLEDYNLSQEYPILRLNNPEQTLVDFNDAEAPFISELSEETMDDRKEFIETYYRAIGEREYYKVYKLSKKDTSLETFQNWYDNTSQVILKSVTHLNDTQSLVELSLMEGGKTINYKTKMTLKFEEGKPIQIEDTEVQVVK